MIKKSFIFKILIKEKKEIKENTSIKKDKTEKNIEDSEKEKEDDFIAEIFDISTYNASASDFPKFRVEDVHNAVIGMTYKLSIPALLNWKIE